MDSIKLISASPCKLQVLYLILSHRNMSRSEKVSEEKLDQGEKLLPVEQDIRGLQHGIGKKPQSQVCFHTRRVQRRNLI